MYPPLRHPSDDVPITWSNVVATIVDVNSQLSSQQDQITIAHRMASAAIFTGAFTGLIGIVDLIVLMKHLH